MKIPISWLREYVEIEDEISELAHSLTMAGLEVGSVEYRRSLGSRFSSSGRSY